MKKEDISAVKLNHRLWGGMNYRNCHDWFPIHFVALVSLYWHLQEYEVNTLTTSLYHSSSRGGRMGFSITAAAVTVTVATSDMLRFCKMKFLRMSIHRSPCKHYLRRKTTFFFDPHWTQRISTRFSSFTNWENYLKALNITSQKRETEKKNPSSLKFTLLSLQCFEDLYKAQITEPELWTYLLRCGAIHSKGWEVIAARTLPAVLISGQYEKVSSFLLLVGAFPRLYQSKVLMHNTSHMSYQVQSMNSLLSTVTIMSTVMCVKHKKPLEGNHCVIDSFSSYSL